MARLGDRVIYTAAAKELTKTVRGGDELKGSIHHPSMTEFAGVVGRVHGSGRDAIADLHLVVPGTDGKWVLGIAEGQGAGQFTVLKG